MPLTVGEVVAIDGKPRRGSFDRGWEQSPLHLVSAWASERGLVLGQRGVEDKSHEITALPGRLVRAFIGGDKSASRRLMVCML